MPEQGNGIDPKTIVRDANGNRRKNYHRYKTESFPPNLKSISHIQCQCFCCVFLKIHIVTSFLVFTIDRQDNSSFSETLKCWHQHFFRDKNLSNTKLTNIILERMMLLFFAAKLHQHIVALQMSEATAVRKLEVCHNKVCMN